MLLLFLIAVLHAAPRDDVDAGDRAWFAGDRRAAAARWQAAAEAPDAPPADAAMAEVRLLHVSGNLGLVQHGPRADAALSRCPAGEARCDLARADYEIFVGLLGLPLDRERALRAAQRAAATLPGPAQARLVLLGAAPPDSLAAYPERDALGDGVLARGGWPQGPGTWLLGLGLSGAPGLGVGLTGRFIHPDLGYTARRLELTAAVTSRGIGQLRLGYRSPLQPSPRHPLLLGQAALARLTLDDYAQQAVLSVLQAEAWAAPGWRAGPLRVWAGPLLRWDLLLDTDTQPLDGHGAVAGLAWQPDARLALTLREEASLPIDYSHHRTDLDLVAVLPLGGGGRTTLAGRLAAAESLGSEAPWWHQPTAGAGTYLRSAPANRWRDDRLLAAAVEVRRTLIGPLGGVLFAEGAMIEGLHSGAGGGLRLALPPRPLNTLRLDLAWSLDGTGQGLQATAGWGEAF